MARATMGPGWQPWGRAIPARQRRLMAAGIHSFAPYTPPPVPPGSYDPSLDAQLGQSQRGLGDFTADTETQNTRDTVDYGTQQGNINRQIGLLQTGYQQLGRRQNEAARHQGVISGGLLMQAAAKRQANETIAQQPLNQSLQQLALDYAPPSADNPLGGRRFQDRTTALTRAQREGSQFGIDVNSIKQFQASQMGYIPPGRGQAGGIPANEHISGTGIHTRTATVGGTVYTYDQNGKIISRRRAAGAARPVMARRGAPVFGGGAY